MKTVYFHIGNFKTGTTAIQHVCNTADLDFCYPRNSRPVENPVNHGRLSLSLLRDYGEILPPPWFIDKNIRFHSEVRALIDEIDSHPSDTALISSEELFRVGKAVNPLEVVSVLREAFSKYKQKVILFVREPFSFLMSWYNQVMIDGARNFLVFSSRPYQRMLAAQYPVYKTYADCFGKENVIALKYSKFGAQHLNSFFAAIGSAYTLSDDRRSVYNTRDNHLISEAKRIASFDGSPELAITSYDITYEYLLEAIDYVNSEVQTMGNAIGIDLDSKLTLDNILDHYFKRVLPLGPLVDAEADCLKSFALSAESNDLKAAYRFIEAASIIRPDCPFLLKKLAEYRQRLPHLPKSARCLID